MEVLVNRLKLFYTESGKPEAPPIVFIHGFPFDHTMWQEQVALCEPSYRVITYDQRGHREIGGGGWAVTYSNCLWMIFTFGLLDHLKIAKTILCGLSMGGYTALRAFERSPERFSGLILCDTRSEAPTPTKQS